MAKYRVPVMPGDGIGPEIIAEGRKVIDAVSEVDSFEIDWIDYPHGADHYLATGELISEDTLKELRKYKSIYLGALGDPRVEPGVLELGILLRLRFYMDEYVNLRPIKLFDGIDTPIKYKTSKDINFTVVRENTEDFYVGLGARVKKGKSHTTLDLIRDTYKVKFGIDVDTDAEEVAFQLGVMSRHGARRVIKYAFDYAKDHNRTKVTAVDKANVITNLYGMWREIYRDVAKGYPGIETDFAFVDATTMWFVKNPEWFQVLVTPNLFGDIITDLGAMIQGGLGFAAGGNINPEGTSMFEPIHGSAPKYKGMNKVNPIATILAGGLLLENLGLRKSADKIEKAVAEVIKDGKVKTYDMGGKSTTRDMGDAVAAKVKTL
ncbi:MAG: isocitrate/isopropylmalate dehydrogenase family protein [Thaumarchaeota archaeon]|nr:isocitrate/isopropylmalate dehydrogenase family protein [Nitrososphaerota archaeon]MCL5316832.1 isocitrate/isopropylmalate dehydrogenase family protein [Nitrososphaerota archaeon]